MFAIWLLLLAFMTCRRLSGLRLGGIGYVDISRLPETKGLSQSAEFHQLDDEDTDKDRILCFLGQPAEFHQLDDEDTGKDRILRVLG